MKNKSERRRIYQWSIRDIPPPFKAPKVKIKMLFVFLRMFMSYVMGMASMEKKLPISLHKHFILILLQFYKIPVSTKPKF